MKNDPKELIQNDHRIVEKLFGQYETKGSDEDRRFILDELTRELSTHTEMEETIAYPAFREALGTAGNELLEEAYREHQEVKTILEELATRDPREPEFDAKMKLLMEQVRHHVKEEEDEMLLEVERAMSEEKRSELGDRMMEFKESNQPMSDDTIDMNEVDEQLDDERERSKMPPVEKEEGHMT